MAEHESVADKQAVWDGFFGEIVGWTFHPGYYRENATKPSYEDCANVADELMKVRAARISRRERTGN